MKRLVFAIGLGLIACAASAWAISAKPFDNEPRIVPAKQYATPDFAGFDSSSAGTLFQVVNVPGFGKCLITTTGGVWCK